MRLLAPEVVQTSSMDCGPAALKCLLEGFGIHVSYGRLREACHTSIDGTSLDDLEDIARLLGLQAEQVMAPVEHVLAGDGLLPALAVIRLPDGGTHLVVLWRSYGGLLQVMDPALGRRWISKDQLRGELYVHQHAVPTETWRKWAESESYLGTQRRRLSALRVPHRILDQLLKDESSRDKWEPLARFDAALRMTESLVRSRAIRPGRASDRMLNELLRGPIPRHYWSATTDKDNQEQVLMSGALLIQVHGRTVTAPDHEALPGGVRAVLIEPPQRPLRQVLHLLRQDGALSVMALLPLLALSGAMTAAEGLLFRGILDIRLDLSTSGQRLAAWLVLLMFLCIASVMSLTRTAAVLRMSRHLELRFRVALLRKLPLLGDAYFRTRLTSDLAQRAHSIHLLRSVPEVGARFLQSLFELIALTAALCWLYPLSASLVLLLAFLQIMLPLGGVPILSEQDLRFRTHTGALSRFYLDALIGAAALRAHGAESAVRRAHGDVLKAWARSGLDLQVSVTLVEGFQALTGFSLASYIIFRHVTGGHELAAALLLAYWCLALPVIGQELASSVWQYPMLRNITLRWMEPIESPEPERGEVTMEEHEAKTTGVDITFDNVNVTLAGQPVLDNINLKITAGHHTAIVGTSGAGKSTLIGLMLGWYKPASGEIFVDCQPLDQTQLDRLRRQTAWIGADVRLWNAALLENVTYGADESLSGIDKALAESGVKDILGRLPDGFATNLRDAGSRLAASEGEQIRFCRALLRRNVRLVVLDEPCPGFDSDSRVKLMEGLRRHWPDATFLCVTHDMRLAATFQSVIVLESGRLVENGSPAALRANENSRFLAMMDAESMADAAISAPEWRTCQLRNGRIEERPS